MRLDSLATVSQVSHTLTRRPAPARSRAAHGCELGRARGEAPLERSVARVGGGHPHDRQGPAVSRLKSTASERSVRGNGNGIKWPRRAHGGVIMHEEFTLMHRGVVMVCRADGHSWRTRTGD